MITVKASESSEAGRLPTAELRQMMSDYHQTLEKVGVRVMAKGLHPGSNGLRISYPGPGKEPVVTHGPFPQPRELATGFILIDVQSRQEAIEWAMQMPDPQGGGEGQIELGQAIE